MPTLTVCDTEWANTVVVVVVVPVDVAVRRNNGFKRHITYKINVSGLWFSRQWPCV